MRNKNDLNIEIVSATQNRKELAATDKRLKEPEVWAKLVGLTSKVVFGKSSEHV
jgi:hypothetical protein